MYNMYNFIEYFFWSVTTLLHCNNLNDTEREKVKDWEWNWIIKVLHYTYLRLSRPNLNLNSVGDLCLTEQIIPMQGGKMLVHVALSKMLPSLDSTRDNGITIIRTLHVCINTGKHAIRMSR